jgi:hypothetical protein
MSNREPPRVFISYSHDSEQHKDWIRGLAERLSTDGVSVLLDQWEIGPGHDVTAFMERGLTSSDWVLIICTEDYVRKANTLKGGVGYERMIVTAEVAENLETNKFIPVLRTEQSESIPRFLGARIYVDFRSEEMNDREYDLLLRALHGMPRHTKPQVGQNPFVLGKSVALEGGKTLIEKTLERASTDHIDAAAWHWHRAVHERCGNTLYIVLLRFKQGSIFFRDSLLDDLKQSQISDFKIFHLYSHWDILIRAWADEGSFKLLRSKFSANPDIKTEKPPEYLIVEHLQHASDRETYANAQVADRVLRESLLWHLRDAQERPEQSPFFDNLKSCGLIVDDRVRFDPNRIQFYITISSEQQLDAAAKGRIERLINRESTGIFNRSVYMTPGSSIQAVLKGQADGYYAIHGYLQAVAAELLGEDVSTETMLVANCEPRHSNRIDFGRAEAYVIDKEFQQLIPANSGLKLPERLRLQSLFAGVWEGLREDRHGVLRGLIRARVTNSTEEIGTALSVFFAPFESRLKTNLVAVLVKEYGPDWQATVDELKKKEKLEAKTVTQFALGDLCKMYKRIVMERAIIDIAPLSEGEFGIVMDAIPLKRNEFSHVGPATVLTDWDDWFSLCAKFVPVHSRLMTYLEKQQAPK